MKLLDRNSVESAVSYVCKCSVLDFCPDEEDEDYAAKMSSKFMKRVCSISCSPNNKWLKSNITEQSIIDVSHEMLNLYYRVKLLNILGIKE